MIKTKILATIGPACNDDETLAEMFDAGLDAARLNFSHGSLADHMVALERVRRIARQRGVPVAVVGDLCGPKIRVGRVVADACELLAGQGIVIQRDECDGTAERIGTNHPAVVDDVAVGDPILIDDGLIRLRAKAKTADEIECEVEIGGTLRGNKGINLPDTAVSTPSLTDKDLADLDWAITHELDYVALSFVRDPDDIYELRRQLKERQCEMGVIAKIEKPQAVQHIDEIIEHSDAVMVARGDLGVEMDAARVPLIQKDIVLRCQRASVPVIIATQMLQSMVDSPVPTRAEVSDVANAILDGADVVMLSAETSIGRHPAQAVATMNRVARETEEFLARTSALREHRLATSSLRVTWAVVHGAEVLARQLGANLVAVWTESGFTARLLSKRHLPQTIVGLSSNERTCRRMGLLYGVRPLLATRPTVDSEMLMQLDKALDEQGLASSGDLIVVVSGTHLHEPGATNALLIHLVAASTSD
ncbi:MAG: pyruvate kinase [Phycisphaerae bacterium]|nr:pyruvate kinase [Phycisphaerae bacterium]